MTTAVARPVGVDGDAGPGRGAPLYETVKRFVRDQIESGEWPAHHQIPSENEIVSTLGVSRMTANRALRELATEGAIVRIKGKGSFVAPKKGSSPFLEIRNIADEITRRGHKHTARIVLNHEERALPEVADSLDVEIGGAVFHTIIVHYENDMPIQIEDRFVSPDAVPAYMEQDFLTLTPNAYLTRVAPITGSEQVVEAVSPQPWECKLLAISRAEPCLMVRRTTWSGPRKITAVRLLYPGSRYRLESAAAAGAEG
ncbi:histidine utilization repressor [Azospirillum sp. ST 5-10]|uniref:histidine utilization repressor n=1 Tax=unclassified Azospirillum TaxID=2630922 RepID=UPI003F4A1C30